MEVMLQTVWFKPCRQFKIYRAVRLLGPCNAGSLAATAITTIWGRGAGM